MICSSVMVVLLTAAIVGTAAGEANGAPPGAVASPEVPGLVPSAGPALMNPWLAGHMIAAVVALAVLWARGVFRPSALVGERRGVSDLPWWVWMSCTAITWLMQVVGMSIAHEVWNADPKSAVPRDLAILGLASSGTAIAGAAVLLRLVAQVAPKAGINAPAHKVLLGVLLAGVMWPVLQCVGFLTTWLHGVLGGEAAKAVAHPMLRMILDNKDDPWVWVLVGVSTLAVPLVEEIIYRGFLQSLILRATGRPWVAVIVGGLIFGAAHLGQGIPWYSVVVVTVLGMSIGFAFEKTKSLGVCIGMHVGFNATNVGLALWMG